MKHPSGTTAWLCVTITTTVVTLAAGQTEQRTERGEQLLNGSCTTCHDLRPIDTQALDKAGWTKTVTTMIDKGAELKAEEVPMLIEYLVSNHGPLPDGPGKKILLNVCTSCHELKRVTRQGASRQQWEETLGAMLNEGAMLSEEDYPVLLNYLAKNFRPAQ